MLSKSTTVFILGNNKLFSFILNYKLSFVNKFEVISFSTADEAMQHMSLKPDVVVFDNNYPRLKSSSLLLQQLRAIAPNISIVILFDKADDIFFKELKKNNECECLVRDSDSSKMADRLIQVVNSLVKTKNQNRLFLYLSIFILFSCVIAAYTLVNLFTT
jgi:DNA-binding NarL/FixJ family response regulator